MKNYQKIFDELWADYTKLNVSAQKIHDMFTAEGETVKNDHIAFRTFNDPSVNIEVLSTPFLKAGYKAAGEYHFEEKKLFAKHFEVPDDTEAPRVFISELLVEEFSGDMQDEIDRILEKAQEDLSDTERIIFSGSIFGKPTLEVYNRLKDESEYASWLYIFGFRANHFTVSVNHLKKYPKLELVNSFLKSKGIKLNTSGGEIKGTQEVLLRQSSTLADIVSIEFAEGKYDVPACYYEFAQRYIDSNGKLYSGFIAKSADKIFESTNYRQDN